MATIKDRGKQLDTILSWRERIWQVLRILGIETRIDAVIAAVVGGFWTVAVRLWGTVPWEWDVVLGLATALLFAKLVTAIWAASLLRGIKALDVPEVGKECAEFRLDLFAFLSDRKEHEPDWFKGTATTDSKILHEQWAERGRYSNETRAKLAERFSHRALAIHQMLQGIGVQVPHLFAFEHSAGSFGAYVGAVGELLQRGLLDEAKSMRPNRSGFNALDY